MKKAELVFVPAPAISHIVPMIEFAECLLERCKRLSITVLVMSQPTPAKIDPYFEKFTTTYSNIRFINLPSLDPPLPELTKSIEKFVAVYIENHMSLVKDAIINHVLSESSTQLSGLVIDLFCSSMIDVANELVVPSYVFSTCSAAFLGLLLYLVEQHSLKGTESSISDPDSIIPAFSHPVPTRVLPSFFFDKNGGYESMLNHGRQIRETKGFIINTFAELESHAIKSLESDKELAPIYTVGPVVKFEVEKQPDSNKIIKWLDDQPSLSVVFLCFGSIGGFEPPQLAKIATALEGSGYRFLWSVQAPTPKDFSSKQVHSTNISDILPTGFLERTKNKGLVCGWTPQLEVLAHKAVGGFFVGMYAQKQLTC